MIQNTIQNISRTPRSADELNRINAETQSLAVVTTNALMARALDRVRTLESREDARATLERMRQDLENARAALTSGGRAAQREQHRAACDALRLHRACDRRTCRKARGCRGNPFDCYAQARVPEPVLDFVATLMLAQQLPWVMTNGHAQERLAFEGWIAGIEARRRA